MTSNYDALTWGDQKDGFRARILLKQQRGELSYSYRGKIPHSTFNIDRRARRRVEMKKMRRHNRRFISEKAAGLGTASALFRVDLRIGR
jgi:hypothetical protein